jgi:predicted NBD/HSP70 family sugar kinase
MLTLGTGIGSAVFVDGVLVPNSEFGHMAIRGQAAERRAAAQVRQNWKASHGTRWAHRLSEMLIAIEQLLWPDLYILGGRREPQAGEVRPAARVPHAQWSRRRWATTPASSRGLALAAVHDAANIVNPF